jgi:hypothetical protein
MVERSNTKNENDFLFLSDDKDVRKFIKDGKGKFNKRKSNFQ